MMPYNSITTEGVEHDQANILAEFIWLNRNIRSGPYPWRENTKQWGQNVAIVKKLMGPSFGLSAEQLAFYIWKCKPSYINPKEFARMVAVARTLFKPYEIDQVTRLYQDRIKDMSTTGIEKTKHKQEKPKTLLTFLRELERGKA